MGIDYHERWRTANSFGFSVRSIPRSLIPPSTHPPYQALHIFPDLHKNAGGCTRRPLLIGSVTRRPRISLRSGTVRKCGAASLLKGKIVCHNLVVRIHEMYELGIEPQFWGENAT